MSSTASVVDTPVREASPATGVRTIWSADRRSPMIEFEIGISAAGTVAPDGRTLAALTVGQQRWHALQREAAENGGGATVAHRGEWMQLSGRLLPFSDVWIDEVSAVVASLGDTLATSAGALAGLPIAAAMDAAWEAAVDSSSWTGAAYVVLVGAEVEEPARRVGAALTAFQRRVGLDAPRSLRPPQTGPAPGAAGIVWLAGPEPASAGSEAERFLATALLTSIPTSHLLRRLEDGGAPFDDFTIGRDVYGGAPRVFAAARVPSGDVEQFATWFDGALAGAGRWEPDAERGRALVNLCRANISAAFESPRALCDGLAESARRGMPATWLDDMSRGIGHVDLAKATASADALCGAIGAVRATA
ncbi:hypothetical protein [Microbacterium hibisci]|uniref:hypothetical protein n=1 Tax=Microbacterium hibisci TaxID=2036000 RepID=UPI001940D7E2|nr:hypothetical protein [Microbacterium hibisci]